MGLTSKPRLPAGLAEGQTLAGKYLLIRKLGEGGMCTVYEAEHIGLQQALALKILKPELATDPGCVERFEREARAAAQLRSPNVARVFDVDWLPSGQPYITMELLVGHDLGGELQRAGRLPIPLAVDYVRQACSGMAEAHAMGIVHRDLKPENIFLTELGELTDRKLVKILDFGIAKNISENARRLTAPDAVFGTVDYMSPDQIRSASKVDHRTDIWSLGIILYELLTGKTPFHGDARAVIAQIVSDPVVPPTVIVPDIPPSLEETVMKALQKDPAERFQSATAMRDALEGYGDFEPITSLIARLPPQSVPRRRSVPAGPLNEARDQRTHASWETKSERRSWSKAWILMPAVAMALGAGSGFVYWRGPALVEGTAAPVHASAPPPAASVAAPPVSAAAAPPVVTPPTPSASESNAPVAVGPDPASEPGPAHEHAATPAKPKKPRAPHPPPATAPPTPPASASAPRNPKHI